MQKTSEENYTESPIKTVHKTLPANRRSARNLGLLSATNLTLKPDGNIMGFQRRFFGRGRRPRLLVSHARVRTEKYIRRQIGQMKNDEWALKKAAR